VLNLQVNPGYVVSLWVAKPSNGADLSGTLLSKGGKGSDLGWALDIPSTGKLRFRTHNGTDWDNLTTPDTVLPLAVEDWTHVVLEVSGGEKRIYINGDLNHSAPYTDPVHQTARAFALGADDPSSPSSYFKGRLDQVSVYGAPLNPAGVKTLYEKEKPGGTGWASITVNFEGDLMDAGETAQLTLYGSPNLAGAPFLTQDIIGPAPKYKLTFKAADYGSYWQQQVDGTPPQGSWEIKSISGSMTVDNATIEVETGGLHYGVTNTMRRIPAPNVSGFNAQINRDVFFAAAVQSTQAVAGYTFAHELGHLLGASHGLGDPPAPRKEDAHHTFSPYGYTRDYVDDGYLSMGNHFNAYDSGSGTFKRYCTIMALPNSGTTRINRFSGPKVDYSGTVTGRTGMRLPMHLGGGPLYMSNVDTIATIGRVVSLYRDPGSLSRTYEGLSGTPSFKPYVPPNVVSVGNLPERGMPDARRARASNQGGSQSQTGSASRSTGQGRGISAASGSTRPGTKSKGIPAATHTPGKSSPGGTSGVTRPGVVVVPPGKGGSGTTAKPGSTAPPPGGVRPNVTKPGSPFVKSPVPNDNRAGSFGMQLRALPGGRWQAVGVGHNVGATAGQGETAGLRTADGRRAWHGRSVWWVLEAPGAGIYEVDASTVGSAIDTTLSVIRPGGDTSSNDNDRRQPTPASRVFLRRVSLKKGDKVYFSVDGVSGAQGQIKLTVKLRKLN
jgi:hypothetical protein